jgi:hypothetical protein
MEEGLQDDQQQRDDRDDEDQPIPGIQPLA